MATQHNFRIKNGLEINGTERITSAGAGSFTDLTLSGDLALTGDLNITGDVNSISVTDLDVTDKTITLGKGQTESNSGGSGIVVDGSSASILWDESSGEWDFNNPLAVVNSIGGDTVLNLTGSYGSGNNVALLGFARAGGAVSGDIRYVDATTDMEIGTGTAHAFSLKTSGTRRLTVDSAGKVGIGTSSPETGLHLYGTSNVASGFTIEQVYGGSSKKFGFQPVYNDDRLDIWYNSNATAAITIKDGGSVGIGTASPSYKFDLYGTSDITMRIHRPSSGLAESDTCGIGFSQRGDANTSTTDTRAAIVSTYNGSLHLCTEPGGNLNSNPVDHSALSIIGTNQYVGIGTSSPTNKLTITDGASPYSTNNHLVQIKRNASNGNDDTSKASILLGNNSNGFSIAYGGTTDRLRFIDGGNNETVSILNGGQVGIANTTPSEKLSVHGAIQASNTGNFSSGNAGIYLDYNPSTGIGVVRCAAWGSAFKTIEYMAATHVFKTGSGSVTERMRIDGNGKVFIGTATSVDDCLAIGNTSRDTAVNMSKASGGAVTREIIRFNGPLRLGVATGGHHTYIYGGGASAYLEINDSGRVLAKNTSTAASPVYTFQNDDNTGLYSPAADTIELSTAGVRGLSVQSDSSVLIGATMGSVNATQKSGKIAGKATPNVMEWDLPRSNTSYQHGDSVSGFSSAYGLSYGLNGDSAANKWKLGEGPSGCTEWLWAGISAGSTGGSGGWGTGNISIDNNYSYLFVLWVKRVSSANTGTYYHGTGGVHDTSGNSLNNPYMTIFSTGTLPLNVWCVDIQPIHAWHMTSNVAMGNQGCFRTDTGARLQQHSGQFSGVNIYRAGTSSNQSHNIQHRTYLYYPSSNDGTELHWACPRLYRIDGSQPSAAELISESMNAASGGMS